MTLSNRQIRHLRGLTHSLQPVVIVADKGLSENVMAEIELALDHGYEGLVSVFVDRVDGHDDDEVRPTDEDTANPLHHQPNSSINHENDNENDNEEDEGSTLLLAAVGRSCSGRLCYCCRLSANVVAEGRHREPSGSH